ncbi:hypothetical protein BKA82DRAFT_4358292 [Pisolithus tinctorius]|nr:hypothetical protein BKA82DRAFT_4358292 [Pisolithus tinctorius]
MGATRTARKQDKQHAATERWLSKPGVREEQREKARLRAARNRTKKLVTESEDTTRNPTPTSAVGASPDPEPNSYLHPSALSEPPPLEKAHVEEGRRLVWILRNIARKGFRGMGYRAADLYEQVFDLLTSLLTELRFFEVKLDDYAPISPLSRISEARYYFTV